MKIVVYGPGRRTGALRDGMVERYLKPGDTVEIRSPPIGSLRASIVNKNASR
jgi:2-keto-4-pentenoate hydratase/2-oxohepta-3-ene-1,7-dioic acid hydratase in catechol pathway